MKINKKKIDERLAGIPDSKRSHIYYAGLILEFLEQNFVPTSSWLPALYKIRPGTPVDNEDFIALARTNRMKLSELYDLYLRWRQVKDYTSEIETKFKFSVIIRNLRLYKNGWEFNVHRVGAAQVWYVGPIAFTDLTPKLRRKVEPVTIERGTVEYDPIAPPPQDADEEAARMLEAGTTTHYTNGPLKESVPMPDAGTITNFTNERFKETRNWVITEYEPDE